MLSDMFRQDEIDLGELEQGVLALEQRIETYERMNEAVRAALDDAILGFEGSGAGVVESIEKLARSQQRIEELEGKLRLSRNLLRDPHFGLATWSEALEIALASLEEA